jgi:hypothetical protein
LHKAAFHSMVDSGGARLFNVEEIISAVTWCTRFNAHLLIHALNAFSSAVSGMHKMTDKTLAGMRTMVIGAAKIKKEVVLPFQSSSRLRPCSSSQFNFLPCTQALLCCEWQKA